MTPDNLAEVLERPYVIGADEAHKGALFAQPEIERRVGFTEASEPRKYRLALLRMIRSLRAELNDLPTSDPRWGAWVHEERGGIKIATDDEAAIGLPARFEQAMRQAARNVAQATRVDRLKITSDAVRETFEAQQRAAQAQLLAAHNAKRAEARTLRAFDAEQRKLSG